ncbi:MAG: xanthine dehydrogenase family protein subunit M [Rhodospirillales bacterium]|nr:xanthine dehydrogenase family protein subunit M [Rhodospirillales bacterium]
MPVEYELDIPQSLDEALNALASDNGSSVTPLAGGTNLIIDIRSRRERPARVVGLDYVSELRAIDCTSERVTIGSRTTVTDLLDSAEIAKAAPSLVDAARVFAGHMVRNAATVGGNIACGSPAADLVPPLMSLDAEVTLSSKSGSRTVALADYFTGYKQDVRNADELITQVAWDRLPEHSVNTFRKLGRRKGDAITVTGVALTVVVEDGVCQRARIALGSVGPTVFRARQAEALLEGKVLSNELFDAAARKAASESSPIDDVRASAEYRLHTIETLTRRLLTQAWARLA